MTHLPETYHLNYVGVVGGTNVIPTATVSMTKGKHEFREARIGDGPVDAVYKAIDAITGVPGILRDYSIHAITRGQDAIGEASVLVDFDGRTVTGKGASTDIIEASAKAYLSAVNKIVLTQSAEKTAK